MCLSLTVVQAAPPGNIPSQYSNGTVAVNYQLYQPLNYSASSGSYPLVIFLHGNGEGEAGDAVIGQPTLYNSNQLSDLGQYTFLSSTNQATFPCFMALVSRGRTANVYPIGLERNNRYQLIGGLIDQLKAAYPRIDLDRVIITGLSGGGGDTTLCAIGNTNRFAAAMPICGTTASNDSQMANLGTMATWWFHSMDDPTVTPWGTIGDVTTLRRQGAKPIFTLYDGGGHGIWTKAYNTPALVPWVAAQRRGLPVQASPATVNILVPTSASTYATSSTPLALSGTTTQVTGTSAPVLSQVQWYVQNATNSHQYTAGSFYFTTSGTVGSWSIPTANLTSGGNFIEVVAAGKSWDPSGTGKTYYTSTLNVTYTPGGDTTAPILNGANVTPATGTTVTAATVTISGTATDNVGLQSVTCKNVTNGNALTTVAISGTSANWNVSVPLVSGANSIEITCKDTANNTSTPVVTRSITYTPSTWSAVNIGGATPAGSYTQNAQAFSLTGGGSSLWWGNNNIYYVYQAAVGDCAIEARVKEIGYSNFGSSRGGILIREGTAATANYAFLGKSADGAIHFYSENGGWGDSNFSIGASTYYWIRLVRVGNTITSYTATDNGNGTHGTWVQFDTRPITLTNPVIGLVICRNDTGTNAITCNLDYVSVTP